ncbi:MAG: segregation ATPase FtsK/SpoIIIE, family [Frankiales bacterium]|nr:segregation ATPase FtsK/SpoIIIE, family [Frankiales bacterium]
MSVQGVDGRRRDLEVRCPEHTTLGELVPQLLAAVEAAPGARWVVDGASPDPTQPAGDVLRHGSLIAVGGKAKAAPDALLSLHAVAGEGAGGRWPLPPGDQLIGRDASNPITLAGDAASRRHARLSIDASGVTVTDLGSTNGIWLRGQRVTATPLTVGEPVHIGGTALAVHVPTDPPLIALPREGRWQINRAPRVLPAAAAVSFTVPAPPPERPAPRLPWLAMAGPLVVGVALAFLMDPRFLLFSLLSPVMAGGQALSDRWHHKRESTRTQASHAQALRDLQAAVRSAREAELGARREAAPDPARLRQVVEGPNARLWERRPDDVDWLTIRLGVGRLPSDIHVEGEPMPPALDDVPVTVDLAAAPVLGVAGPLAARRSLGWWVACQAAALHSPLDLEVAVLATDSSAWSWACWLPHLRTFTTEAELLAGLQRTDRPTLLLVDGARELRATPGLADLLRAPGRHAVVCLDERVEDLPGECAAVAQVSAGPVPALELRVRGAAAVAAVLPDLVGHEYAERVARDLAPLVDATPRTGAAGLPAAVAWGSVGGLQLSGDGGDSDRLMSAWSTPTTRVVIGVGSEGPLEVDLAADGPHALVAGTTGSGKSEALRTLVAALAAANPPEALSFVLVDYKGGAAFGACARLPHVAGMVTDLDPSLTERALASLSAELKRRELLLARAGVDNLADYPGSGTGWEPLARLVIVVDEFATLAEELPDFVGGLVGIAQRGRSLGVHLVLATQRPEGCVSADIRANTALRLCLAVNTDAESRDVVDAPDAALIPPGLPGRGYVRAGSGTLRPVQVARVTAPLPAAGADVSVRPAGLVSEPLSADLPHGLDLLVAAACELADTGAVQPARSPWLAPLPHPISGDGAAWAVADLPERQAYAEVRSDLSADGHLIVVGAPRSGRSTAARAVVSGLLATHSADELHVYAVDDSGSLADLAELPHCGAVVRVHDADRLVRMIGMLTREVARRRDAGGEGEPRLLLVVDRWESALDALELRDGGRWADALHALVSDGAAAGLHVVAVVGGRAPSGRLSSAVDRRLVLRMADPTDMAMFGIPLRCVPSELPPGRGFLVDAGGARLVQVVLPHPYAGEGTAADRPPRRVDPLPVSIDVISAELLRRKPRPEGRACVLLGVGGDELSPVDLDVVDVSPAFVVAGPPRSGRSTALARIVSGLLGEGIAVAALLPRASAVAAVPGVVVLAGDELTPPADHVLVCDDVELAEPGGLLLLEAALREARDGGPTVLLAGTTDDLAVGFRGPVVEARRSRCGLVLAPRTPHDGELLGTRLPQPSAGEVPPGRGMLVVRGAVCALQVAL